MDTNIIDCPVDTENANRKWLRVANWWEAMDFEERWPLSTDEAAGMLATAGQYRIDADGLRDLIDRKLIDRPGVGEADDFEWNATEVCIAGQILEAREQWRANPSGHDRKKHCFQIALENARKMDGVKDLAESGGPRYDVAGLLPALVNCDSLEGRRQIVALLKAVLEVEHGVIV